MEKKVPAKAYRRSCIKAIRELLQFRPDELVQKYLQQAREAETETQLISVMIAVRNEA